MDAVYIGLPNGLHPEWTVRAAGAGKHILCEKPVARTRADAERMAAAAREAGVILMEAFMYRLHPQHARVRELIEEGAIGEPVFVRATFCFAMARERREARDVRLQAELQGGALMDVGCYAVNAARYVFGAEPLEVAALERRDPGLDVDTAFAGTLRFPGDRLAQIDGSFDAAGTQRYEVAGPGGRSRSSGRSCRATGGQLRINAGGPSRVEEIAGDDQYALEADHVARSVRAGRLLPPAEDGVRRPPPSRPSTAAPRARRAPALTRPLWESRPGAARRSRPASARSLITARMLSCRSRMIQSVHSPA